MRKKIITYILLAGMLFSAPATVRAESLTSERNVSFTSENELDADYGNGDMDSEVHNLQPGDDITITINLKNDNPSTANWYMTNEVLQSLEETTGTSASGGAYEYELTYTDPEGAQEILFTSDTVGGENSGSRVGLKAATSGLEDYLYLDTLSPGQKGVITLRVALDGETEGNAYQNTLARLQMNFAVDTNTVNTETVTEVVEDSEDPTVVEEEGGQTPPGGSMGTGVVRTSDENNILPLILAAAVSGVLFLILAVLGVKERRKQKGAAKTLAVILAICLAGSMSHSAQAAESGEGYTYTLRLYAGAQGTIDASVVQRLADGGARVSIENGEVCIVSGLHYGTQVVFDVQRGVTLNNNSKYYRKGFRVSGEDNGSGSLANPSVTVEGDQDFVVAYGIQGEIVAYTVNYVDQNGNRLYPSAVYYGNVGDKPVVAYQYIEGWQPQAYNLGKTLSADASENVFNFVYAPIPTVTNTETIIVPGPPVEPQPPVVIPAQPQPPVEPQPEETVPEPQPEGPVEIGENEIPTGGTPDEYRDLDDQENPMGNYEGGNDENDGGNSGGGNALTKIIEDLATPLALLPTPVKAGIAATVALMAGAVVWLVAAVHRKRKKSDGE